MNLLTKYVCAQIQQGASDISIETGEGRSQLTISSGQQEHCGCYTIELRNAYGLRQAALNLTIVGMTTCSANVDAKADANADANIDSLSGAIRSIIVHS